MLWNTISLSLTCHRIYNISMLADSRHALKSWNPTFVHIINNNILVKAINNARNNRKISSYINILEVHNCIMCKYLNLVYEGVAWANMHKINLKNLHVLRLIRWILDHMILEYASVKDEIFAIFFVTRSMLTISEICEYL